MRNLMKKTTGRISLVVALLLLMATILVGCGGNANVKTITVNKDAFIENDDNGGLKMTELSQIADMLAATCTNEFDTQELIVAAYRGWDMTSPGFRDDRVNEGPMNREKRNAGEYINLGAVKNVIKLSNEKATADKKLSDELMSAVMGTEENGILVGGINKEDTKTLVKSLQVTVDLKNNGNFFDTLLTWIGAAVSWITNTLGFGSYIVGICIFAVIIEILMLPFGIRQQKNSIRQAKLRPKEMAIRAKYAGRTDQATMQKLQQEIQEFYQKENFSPYSGCLPLLIQLPIILALYNIVIDPLHYVLGQTPNVANALTTFYSSARAAGGLGFELTGNQNTIVLLSQIKESGTEVLEGLQNFLYFSNGDGVFESLNSVAGSIPNFSIGGVNFGLTPSTENWILLLVPIVTFVSYLATSKINRKLMAQPAVAADDRQTACSNNIMDITMPLMSTFFTFMVPALIGVYWVFRSLVGLLKQFILSKLMPLPTFTEEDYKQAAKEMAGKKRVQKSERAGKVRSLHYIDDEDFEDTRERGLARRAAIEAEEKETQKKKAKDTPFEAEAVKTDDRVKSDKKGSKKDQKNTDEASEETNDDNKN